MNDICPYSIKVETFEQEMFRQARVSWTGVNHAIPIILWLLEDKTSLP